MLACNAHFCGTGRAALRFSREGGISGDQFWADVLASSRLKPVPQGDAISVGARLARGQPPRCIRQTASSFIVGMPPRPSALLQTDEPVGDSMLACNTHSCGTGFSRECGISGDQFRADVLASSRLKPVPQGDAISVGARLARESAASVYQANRVIVLRRNAAQTKHRSSRKMHSNRCLFHA